MATGAAPGSAQATSSRRDYERTIDRHLNRTRRQVKLIELAASSVLLLAGVLGFLLVASLIDHWLVGLGTVGRGVLLAALLAGVTYYVWRYLLPLLVRSINPEYAAHAIEESTPTLKNSLLNFLLLRRSPTGVKGVVLEALEKRAASDIAAVPVDAAIDRSKLIRMGYVLVGVMAVLGLYKILSPKDPFQTAARVLAPWADIARPSRVQISDVQPGTAEVYLGETVKVSAAVAGVRDGDPVSIVYSTADGTMVNQTLPMEAAAGGRFEVSLPPGGTAGQMSSTGGLQQSTTYRIEAGDAVSPDFQLNVIAAPRIVVEEVEYLFPAYTRKAPQKTDRGDLKGLEGTRVAITARANQPIKTAWIEFDPQPDGGPVETAKLQVDGDRATGVLVLQLRPDRRTPWRSAYQVRFINERQQQSHQPILHGIEVLRDLPPEVEIVTPAKREIEVPENGSQAIEVRAVDPDFGLTAVKLLGKAQRGAMVRDIALPSLVEPGEGQPPQVLKRYEFRPSTWKLQPGDVVNYWAVAEDNRTAVPSVASVQGIALPSPDPEPNAAKTEQYTIRIVPARGDRGEGASGNQGAEQPMGSDGQSGDEGAQQDSPMNGGQSGDAKSGDAKSGDSKTGDSQSGENQSGDMNSQKGEQGGSKSQGGSQSSDGGEQSSGSESGEGGQSGSQQGGKSSSSSKSGESGSQNSGEGTQGSEGGAGASGQGSGQSGSQSSGEQTGQPGEQTGESSDQPGSRGGSQGGPGPQKPEHDGEVFDRLLEEFKDEPSEQGGQGGGEGAQNGAGQNAKAGADQSSGGQSRPMTGDQPGGGENQGEGAQQPRAGDGASRGGNDSNRPSMPQDQPRDSTSPSGDNAGQPRDGDNAQGGNAQAGKTGPQGSKTGSNKRPQPDGSDGSPQDGSPDDANAEKADGPQGSGKKPMRGDDAQGKGPNDQKAPGDGGRPQGGARTDEGDPKTDQQGSGEPKEAGAGQNGDSGAGKNSSDKTGSGQGQETNRDRQKNMSDSSATPENGETSAPSGSKRQSDSKGGTSGDRSGGGSKGAGQSAGQEGNDSAGSKSAADEGAGAAKEQGMGETGSKGGMGEKSDGQTGSAGDEKGEGSSSRPSDMGTEKGGSPESPQDNQGPNSPQNSSGDRGPQPGQGDSSAQQQSGDNPGSSAGEKTAGGAGPVVGGGQQGDRPQVDYGPEGPATEADKANLDYAKKATDLVLSKLKEQEHNPDPELLDRLGMSREQMQEFIRRWDNLKSEAGRDPEAARELNEALRSLGLQDPKQRKRSGGSVSDDQRSLRDSGTRIPPPSKYRDQFDAFRKGAARAGSR